MNNVIIVRTGLAPIVHLVATNSAISIHYMVAGTPDLHTNHALEREIMGNGGDFVLHTDDGRTFYGTVKDPFKDESKNQPHYIPFYDENKSPCGAYNTIWMAMHINDIL